jgi:hypothetical protein
MYPSKPPPGSRPDPEPNQEKRSTFRPLLSRRPGSPLASLLPLVASLRPLRRDKSVAPEARPAPVINYLPDSNAGAPPGAAQASDSPKAWQPAPQAPPGRSIPIPSEHSTTPHHKAWRRAAARIAVLPVVGLAVAGAAYFATKGESPSRPEQRRGVATPGLKETKGGQHVRWHRDSIDVVVDKSFSQLAGPKLFGSAVDAWRATGANLPSVSTQSGKDLSVGYKSKGDNANVVVYAPAGWERAKGALAITVLTFEEQTGRILDGDILLNGGGRYFAVFDKDESTERSSAVAIDGTGLSAETTPGATAKYDVQSVTTHELGHFFGLGEDYDDAKATMYVSTRFGEIHKRVVTKNEGTVISGLYAATAPASEDTESRSGGCGGAQLAKPGQQGAAWLGFVVAGLGLGLYAAARRARDEQNAVRIRVRSPRARRIGRVGGFLTVIGLVTSLAPPVVEAAPDDGNVRGDAEVEIVKSTPHWVDGIVETELTYRVTACHVAHCPQGDQNVTALGGKLDGVTQIVGPFGMPEVGTRVTVGLRDGRGLLKTLRATFQP